MRRLLVLLTFLLIAALPAGMVENDLNYTTEAEIAERVAAIRAHRNLPPDPASDAIWVERILEDQERFGEARIRITHKAEAVSADRFIRLANESRAAEGIGPLPRLLHLDDAAKFHSEVMADEDRLFHSYDITGEVDNWCFVGENVGRDSSAQLIHDALMASDPHRDIILGEQWTGFGIGVVWRDGSIWITAVYRVFCETDVIGATS